MPTFPYLPGTTVQLEDQGLQISRPPNGPSVLLLGMTTSSNPNAAVNTPYIVSNSSISQADQYFRNSDGTVSELCAALYECQVAGGQNIILCNILPSASGYTTNTTASGISQYGVIAGNCNNNDKYGYLAAAYNVLINYPADIVVPVGVHLDDVITANYGQPYGGTAWNFGYQLANFCYQASVNNYPTIGVIGVNNANNSYNSPFPNGGTMPITASGVPTLANMSTWVNSLTTYSGALSTYNGTTQTSLGVPGNYCYVATSSTQMPPNWASGDVLDAMGYHVDIGSYISVVAASVQAANIASFIANQTLGYINSTGVAAYAGLISSLPSQSAPTNKIVNGITLQQGLSQSQANALCGARYVTFISKSKGICVASAMTGAYNINNYARSDYVRLTTKRIVNDAVGYIRQVGDQFIGEPNNAPQRNALNTAINTALTNMQSSGALQRFDFTVYASPTDQVLGNCNVQLVLVPSFEMQQIIVTVALTAQ